MEVIVMMFMAVMVLVCTCVMVYVLNEFCLSPNLLVVLTLMGYVLGSYYIPCWYILSKIGLSFNVIELCLRVVGIDIILTVVSGFVLYIVSPDLRAGVKGL